MHDYYRLMNVIARLLVDSSEESIMYRRLLTSTDCSWNELKFVLDCAERYLERSESSNR